jgi:hypothetical protein
VIFPQKYFLGDNENEIEIHIWSAMLANLLVTLVRAHLKHKCSFSNLVSVIGQQLMSYINIYGFLENPEGSWREIIKENKMNYQNSPSLNWRGLGFSNCKIMPSFYVCYSFF